MRCDPLVYCHEHVVDHFQHYFAAPHKRGLLDVHQVVSAVQDFVDVVKIEIIDCLLYCVNGSLLMNELWRLSSHIYLQLLLLQLLRVFNLYAWHLPRVRFLDVSSRMPYCVI